MPDYLLMTWVNSSGSVRQSTPDSRRRTSAGPVAGARRRNARNGERHGRPVACAEPAAIGGSANRQSFDGGRASPDTKGANVYTLRSGKHLWGTFSVSRTDTRLSK